MPTAPVNDNGAFLYYEDTGAPTDSSIYVTLVLVHGAAVNSGIFRAMIPYAAQNGLRLVLVNARDYKGSTPYTSAEIDAIRSSDPHVQAAALQARGLELARFMAWFIENEKIPLVSDSGENGTVTGGLSLLGWSAGNCQTLSVLAYADKLPERLNALLGRYLRSVIVYDVARSAIGGVIPRLLYGPLRDTSLSSEEQVAAFPLWVSTYYSAVESLVEMETLLEILRTRQDHPLTTAEHRPTSQRLTPAETEDVLELDVMRRSQIAIMSINPSIYKDNFRRTLGFAEGQEGHELVLPKVKLQVFWCDMTFGDCIAAAQIMREEYESLLQKGVALRQMKISKLRANHFAHWDQPEDFVKALKGVI